MMTQPGGASESVLAHGLTFEGTVEGDGSLRVAGRVRGQLKLSGRVTVEPHASVEGEINAERVVLAGEAKARIQATAAVQIQESAAVTGDVEAESVSVSPGARFRGNIVAGFPAATKERKHPAGQ